ncbi:unnamed protein product [Rotaria magnacalcarata]|uniref:Uncharacterized protein n=1 Tax=Rotaria magnacalcarata TaxID=392030 RepID=A0A816XMS8_9BILA|nr:unnamed protein product [Rotaria magnacalcarata]
MATSDNSEETKFYTSEQCGNSNCFKYYLFVREQVKQLYISFMVNSIPQAIKYQTSIIDYQTMTSVAREIPAGIVVIDLTIINSIAVALRTLTNFAASSNGFPWAVGTCGTGMELTAAGTMCICTNGYILRPCDNYTSWGGIDGLTCAAPSQSITVSFE